MKKALLMVSLLVVLFSAGCLGNVIDEATTVKNIYFFKSLMGIEVLVLEVDRGSLVVWAPNEKLKKFIADIKPGDRIFLKAEEEGAGPAKAGAWIKEIIKLSDGSRYKRGA
jgi:hypothetical protein